MSGEGADAARGGAVLTWLRHHPAPRFLATGGGAACVDLGALALLHGVLGVELVLSTILAYACSFAVNFTVSRNWVFAAGRSGRAHHQAARYIVLVLINLVLTVVIVSALVALGVFYLAAKVISIGVITIGNYFVYRVWVFT